MFAPTNTESGGGRCEDNVIQSNIHARTSEAGGRELRCAVVPFRGSGYSSIHVVWRDFTPVELRIPIHAISYHRETGTGGPFRGPGDKTVDNIEPSVERMSNRHQDDDALRPVCVRILPQTWTWTWTWTPKCKVNGAESETKGGTGVGISDTPLYIHRSLSPSATGPQMCWTLVPAPERPQYQTGIKNQTTSVRESDLGPPPRPHHPVIDLAVHPYQLSAPRRRFIFIPECSAASPLLLSLDSESDGRATGAHYMARTIESGTTLELRRYPTHACEAGRYSFHSVVITQDGMIKGDGLERMEGGMEEKMKRLGFSYLLEKEVRKAGAC
ncbi:hypothetical protein DFH07DRAFT_769397 [Mycena maculata]|uniref:Uncharacterized protein n=1 Tax=Mycena maculata TaxID=230809 RepID=A0AAD7JM75_9AGAR|nr:hypothetical protein DFH07DRAFT_769397 [Mycena maculata]